MTLDATLEEIKNNKRMINELDQQSSHFSQEDIETAHSIIDVLVQQKYSTYKMFKGPNMLLAEGGGCVNMYIALIGRDIFHAATDGRFVPISRSLDYQHYKY